MAEAKPARSVNNMLSFDIEDWYHANYAGVDLACHRGKESRFRSDVDLLLRLCDEAGCRATCFVLGSIAEDHPDIVRQIAAAGHEVASHGYAHELAYRQTLAEFRADVKKSTDLLQNITGVKIFGYRAPSWSIVKQNLHYLAVLEELGFQYDASIFPVKTFLYGIPDASREIHHPVVHGQPLNLFEVPMSVTKVFGRNVGYSGGFYFRLLPTWLIKKAILAGNEAGRSSILYLHPRELDPAERRLELPPLAAFIQYFNVGGTQKKLAEIFRCFRFGSITEHLAEIQIHH